MTTPRSSGPSKLRRLIWLAPLLPLLVAMMVLAALESGVPGNLESLIRFPVLSAVAVALLLALILIWLMIQQFNDEIREPSQRILEAIEQLQTGQPGIRTGVVGHGPVAEVGHALDGFLERRFTPLLKMAKEGRELSGSIAQFAQVVTAIRQGHLSARAAVPVNASAVLAESLNRLIEDLRRLAVRLQLASQRIEQGVAVAVQRYPQLGRALAVERSGVLSGVEYLSGLANEMALLADKARTGDEIAERALEASALALRSVQSIAQGIDMAQRLVQDSERRLKRLGESHQELGQGVAQLHDLASRTGVLALNLSLKAAAAGPAAREFALLGDEVKRLAQAAGETGRELAQQLVSTRAETADTVRTTNRAIEQLLELSGLGAQMAQHVGNTREQTETLALQMQAFSRGYAEQAVFAVDLRERVEQLRDQGSDVDRQLAEQADQIATLVQAARAIRDELTVFRMAPTEPPTPSKRGGQD